MKIIKSKKDISNFKKNSLNKKVSMCHGVFDVVHLGHINHFKYAKKISDILVVSVTIDKFVNKGKDRPIFSIDQRISFLSNLKIVDYLIVSNFETAVNNLKIIKPNFYLKDKEYESFDISGNIKKEINAVKLNKGKIIYTRLKKFSSSKIIKDKDLTKENHSLSKKINQIKKNENIRNFLIDIEKFNLRPLIIGEGIIDKYLFSSGLGKSGKDSILTLKKINEKSFLGGSFAIANNLSNYVKKIGLISDFVNLGSNAKFVKKNLNRNISFKPFVKKGSVITTKTKILDKTSYNKVLGLYEINDRSLTAREETDLYNLIKKQIKNYDFIIVADYDHGLISKNLFKKISSLNKKIISTSQLNAANSAYHNLKKLDGSDLMVINFNELISFFKRRDLKNKEPVYLGKKFLNETKIKNLIITVGSDGSYYLSKKNYFYFPALAENIVGDKIGSGDSFMSLASIGYMNQNHPLTVMLMGALSAKFNLKGLGNSISINKKNFLKILKDILT